MLVGTVCPAGLPRNARAAVRAGALPSAEDPAAADGRVVPDDHPPGGRNRPGDAPVGVNRSGPNRSGPNGSGQPDWVNRTGSTDLGEAGQGRRCPSTRAAPAASIATSVPSTSQGRLASACLVS